jgi:Bacterial regulatory helix-turn-helix protein, lysR family/GMC oxidoreductase
MDRFDAMRVFARVVERRSFSLAADDLGLPRSTVTDAVKALEARLGVRLLERTTRQVRPTLDGEAHYRRCLSLISDLEDAEGAPVPDAPTPPIGRALQKKDMFTEGVRTDDDIRAVLRARADTVYHPVGTCKMGVNDSILARSTVTA